MEADNPDPTPRWHRLTPDRLLLGLLAAQGPLWLSGWLRWPPWHKGYSLLVCLAVTGATLVLLLLWLAVAWVLGRRFQFGIRWLLILTVAVAVPCSWLAYEIRRAKAPREGLATIDAVFATAPSVGLNFRQALPPFPPETPQSH